MTQICGLIKGGRDGRSGPRAGTIPEALAGLFSSTISDRKGIVGKGGDSDTSTAAKSGRRRSRVKTAGGERVMRALLPAFSNTYLFG